MDMQVEALDILTTKGRLAPETARAIGEAMDLQIKRSYENLATNQRVTELVGELRTEVHIEIGDLRAEAKATRAELVLKIEEAKTQLLRWMLFAMIGQTATLAGLMRLFMPHGP
jgi:hypothetical protein